MLKIGNVEIKTPIFLAPMAGVTNEAFRIICHELGAGLVYAEMVSDKAVIQQNQKTLEMIKVNELEHPISMQIFGTDLETFVEAAKYIDKNSDCDIIDINMGCPAPKIAIKSQAGAFLLKHPNRIYEVVKAVVEAVDKPVTVKIRLGWDEDNINCVEVAKLIEKAGAQAIAVHSRTRNQFYSGKADWNWIKRVKESVKIPVIGNGDVFSGEDAARMLAETGCDAVMIARGAQGNPWIFQEINHYLTTQEKMPKPSLAEWRDVIFRHADLLMGLKGERIAASEMRKNLAFYFRGKPAATSYKIRATQINSINELKELVNEYINGYDNYKGEKKDGRP
ncbi:tRNA dihydrouridine synthase DusB [Spiroplasma chrysopicola]|uniref:tRNA-dihydrouridine synthase n=1 Tax=Spiroplasma chrysopicola DF-1 TaxID=1276227 RepID=R4U054_9MOLU|nr:tRNA dihydrouridine synthase DusB [Spiroplasma chrysopicola]AGM24607.1 tRNA-dihydrouridine synthase B [Spiroplasma chrysopicola DF-1]